MHIYYSLGRTTSPRFLTWLIATSTILWWTSAANAQGPLRRVGERVRGAVQQRLNQPPATDRARLPLNLRGAVAPPANSAAVDAGQANAAARGGVAPATDASSQDPSSVIRSNYNRSIGNNTAGNNTTGNNTTGNNIAEITAAAGESNSDASDLPGVLGLVLEPAPPRQVPGRAPVPTRGALVVGTAAGSGGEAAGIREGDLVVAIDGRIVNTVDDLVTRLRRLGPGDNVSLRIVRDGKLMTANTVLAGLGGKLDAATYAQVRQAAGLPLPPEMAAANSAPARSSATGNGEAAQPSSSLGSLGRVVGGWLGGGTGTSGSGNANQRSARQPAASPTPDNLPAADTSPTAADEELPPPVPQTPQAEEPNVAPEFDGGDDSLPAPAALEPV